MKTNNERIFIRFGNIPTNERSKKGNGLSGDGYRCVGLEEGVSVWDSVLLKDGYHLVAPRQGNSCTYGDFSAAAFPDDCLGYNPEDKIYVVTGNVVGRGADNEPLLRNVRVIKELPFDYFKYSQKTELVLDPRFSDD